MKVKDLPQNQPAPPVPVWFIRRLVERFGRNPFRQPTVSIEWGMTPNKLVDGIPRIKAEYLKYRYKIFHGYQKMEFGDLVLKPVYRWYEIGSPCFYACDWWPPELLGKSTWDTEMFGPFPEMGEHRSFAKLVRDDGEPIMPSQEMFERIEAIWAIRDRARQLHGTTEGDSAYQEKLELDRKLAAYNANWDAFWKRHEEENYEVARPYIRKYLETRPDLGRPKKGSVRR